MKLDSDWMDHGDVLTKKLYLEKVNKFFLRDSLQQAQAVFWLSQVIPQMRTADSILKANLRKDSIFAQDVRDYQPTDSVFMNVKKNTLTYFNKYGITPDMSLGAFIHEAEKYLQSARIKLT